jgi:nucleotide-binding universal stress UspA family protein
MPAQTIEAYVHERPGGMLVPATNGRTGFSRFLLGSVSHQLVQHAGVPTLLFHAIENSGKDARQNQSVKRRARYGCR